MIIDRRRLFTLARPRCGRKGQTHAPSSSPKATELCYSALVRLTPVPRLCRPQHTFTESITIQQIYGADIYRENNRAVEILLFLSGVRFLSMACVHARPHKVTSGHYIMTEPSPPPHAKVPLSPKEPGCFTDDPHPQSTSSRPI